VSPQPDGGYPNQNTAEGDNALLDLTSGASNMANGARALFNKTTGASNNLSKAGWSWGCVATVQARMRTADLIVKQVSAGSSTEGPARIAEQLRHSDGTRA